MARVAVRECVTLAGRAERARAARSFVNEMLGPGHPCGDVAVLPGRAGFVGGEYPVLPGPYRDIRASTEPARTAIGLDQLAVNGRHRQQMTLGSMLRT